MSGQHSRQQLRRQARRLRRDGYQPMAILDTGGHIPATPAVLAARSLWRHRSELLPIALASLITLAAIALHRSDRGTWPSAASGVLAATTALAVPPPAWLRKAWTLFDRPAERVYATVTIAMAGGWFSAAIAIGPATPPMPVLGVLITATTAIPWWANGRRRAKVRVERKLDAWPEIARVVGLAGSQVMSAVVDVWGWRARFRLARGQTITDVMAKIPALESALGTLRGAVRVYPTPDNLANRCELRVLDMDPHADAIGWPGPSVTTITQPIDFGPFEDATPCRVLLLRRHGLAGGATGAGKSGWLNVLMGNLAACRDVVIWAIDLKKGMELQPWQSCIDRLATTPEQATVLLRDAVAILQARAEWLTATGQRTWKPSPDMPALVIIIDEYAELSEQAPETAASADSIARLGRCIAVTLIAATQRPTQKAMGQGAVRSQMDVRICFRVRERKDVDLILGQGMLNAGWQANTLNAPGKFLVSAPEHSTPKRARAYLVTDDNVAETARRYAASRPPLDDISRQALRGQHPDEQDVPANPQPADEHSEDSTDSNPDAILWAVLSLAPDDGVTVPDLMNATEMSRPWIYLRLRDLTNRGQVAQVSRGRWRAVASDVP